MAEIAAEICSNIFSNLNYFAGYRRASQGAWCCKRHDEEEANTAATLERTEATQLRDTQVQPTGTAPMQERSHPDSEGVPEERGL